MDTAISTQAVRKTYRSVRGVRVAVEGLDLDVPAGGVHGFLGPNGSGKTTTIRLLLGLSRADSGRMELLGHQVPRHLPQVMGRIGAVVEKPRFFTPFSAHRTLALAAEATGTPPRRVDAVLDQVGLADRAKDPVRTFSLGMQQRLAIALTLLKDPELLIFDEPTNGLDPAGIHEVRETIRTLGREGRTVLVSSHLLGEIEQVADTLTVVARGRRVAHGSVVDLLGTRTARMRVQVDDCTRAAKVLAQAGMHVIPEPSSLLVEGAGDPSVITRLLAEQGLFLRELASVRPDLESVYLELTRGLGPGPTRGPGIELPARMPAVTRATEGGQQL